MEKQLRKLNAELKRLNQKQEQLLSNKTNMSDDDFRMKLYINNNAIIGLIGEIQDYHQRRKIECANGVPMEYFKELLSDPIVIAKFSVLKLNMVNKGEDVYYDYEAEYLQHAFLTLVFLAGFDLAELEPLPPEGIIKLYIDGQDPQNHGKKPDLKKYM
jgi:hypothetical protein